MQPKSHSNGDNSLRIRRTRKMHLWWLSLAVMLAYLSSLPGDFVWLDHQDIERGAMRLTAAEDWGRLWTDSSDQYRDRLEGWPADQPSGGWQPLLVISYSLDWMLWGDCATCYRLENALWHLITVIGLYVLGRHLLYHRRHGKRTAFWAAAAFALHPLGVSVVGWAGGRGDLLFAAFSVWALVAISRLPASTSSDHDHSRHWLVLSIILSCLALLASPAALLILPSALLLTWYDLRERGRRRLGSISLARRYVMLLLAAISILYIFYRSGYVGFDSSASRPGDALSQTSGTLINLFWHYLGLVFVPGEPLLSDSWPITELDPALVAALFGLILLLALIAAGIYIHNPFAFGGAWFMLWLLPGSGLFPLSEVYAESQLYPASWGMLFVSAHLLVQLWRPLGRQLARGSEAILLAPLLLALGMLTGLSNTRWWNDESLMQSEVDIDPYYLNGRLMLAERALANNRPLDANPHLFNALDGSEKPLYTGHWRADKAYTLLSESHLRLALNTDAKEYAGKAVELAPYRARPWYLLGSAQLALGHTEEAIKALQAALERKPDSRQTQARLGAALIMHGELEQGLALLAPQSDIADAMELEILAGTEIDRGDFTQAIDHLKRALGMEIKPDRQARLAWALWRSGNHDAARDALQQAMEMASPPPEYVAWVASQMGENPLQMRLDTLLEEADASLIGTKQEQP